MTIRTARVIIHEMPTNLENKTFKRVPGTKGIVVIFSFFFA